MDTRDIVEQLQDACDLQTDKRELERLCGNAKAEIVKLRQALAKCVEIFDKQEEEARPSDGCCPPRPQWVDGLREMIRE